MSSKRGCEVMLDTPRVKVLIKRGEIHVLKDAMEQSAVDGCQTFDSALHALYAAGKITEQEALRNADSANNLRIRMERLRAEPAKRAETSLRLVGEAPRHALSGVHRVAAAIGCPPRTASK